MRWQEITPGRVYRPADIHGGITDAYVATPADAEWQVQEIPSRRSWEEPRKGRAIRVVPVPLTTPPDLSGPYPDGFWRVFSTIDEPRLITSGRTLDREVCTLDEWPEHLHRSMREWVKAANVRADRKAAVEAAAARIKATLAAVAFDAEVDEADEWLFGYTELGIRVGPEGATDLAEIIAAGVDHLAANGRLDPTPSTDAEAAR